MLITTSKQLVNSYYTDSNHLKKAINQLKQLVSKYETSTKQLLNRW